ncbi:hypothetical protein OIU77_028635 [Salix suchowensis]|uniref:Uncharacterized protein n=1 Tax=Salix suchowensis TaxID=1278906 RepID=A0ABQ9BI35_9ROSI|nr:hypothetical protein OIU77_028635 [Salix suchowensis]
MNATPFSPPDPLQDSNLESDTETNPDDTTEYYQPISAVDHDDSHSDQSNSDEEHHNSPHLSDYHHHHLDNGHCARQAEDGISTLTLNEDVEGKGSSSDDDDEEEFRRREENARRVMEAMRGVSFGSFVPDWAGGVRGEQWIDELRRLRQPPGDGNQPSFRN